MVKDKELFIVASGIFAGGLIWYHLKTTMLEIEMRDIATDKLIELVEEAGWTPWAGGEIYIQKKDEYEPEKIIGRIEAKKRLWKGVYHILCVALGQSSIDQERIWSFVSWSDGVRTQAHPETHLYRPMKLIAYYEFIERPILPL